jgi:TolB-like protein/Tfp pilus assembly protein PilF
MPERQSHFKAFITKLRKRHIIETFAGFIAGGWLFLEFVDRILVAHYELNKKWLDVSFITLLGALLFIILWRWFSRTEKRPGNLKVEVLLVPLIILVTLAIDLNLILQMAGIPGKKLLIGIVAFLLGIAWVIFKLSQWAASTSDASVKKFDISKLPEIKPEKSIVVLPFKNISPEEGQDYFSDGMTEELITKLSMVRELRVISRTSAFMLKNAQKTAKEIAGQLDVGYVLEGSVRKSGNRLRITAQLIDAMKDAHLWSDTYDGVLEDVFDIQEKVSRAIVDGLKLQLTPAETQKITERPIGDLRAYECYLRATVGINKTTEKAIQEALRDLQLALEIVGENALLYCGMSYAYLWLANIGIAIEKNLAQCEAYANKALAIDPASTKARSLLGLAGIAYRRKRPPRDAVAQLKQVLRDDPNEPLALLALLWLYTFAGQIPALKAVFERYAEREPLDVWTYAGRVYLSWFDGHYDRALEEVRRALAIFPDSPAWINHMAWGLAWVGQADEAIAYVDQATRMAPNHVHTKLALMLKHGLQADVAGARAELTPEFYEWCHSDPTWSYFVAASFALANMKDDALEWLEHAVDLGWINYPLLAEKDPFLANIRGEPRFKKLMERVKYEWEHFEV